MNPAQSIALLPGLAALLWLYRKSYREAFLDVYLFSLFLLPGWCRFVIPGLPDPMFHEAAILPIACAFLWRARRSWKWSVADVLVIGYALATGYSELITAGYPAAQNLMFDMFAAILFPYLLTKGIVEPSGLRVAFVKRVVSLLAILIIPFCYEFKFGYNPYRLLFDPFFPGQGDGWVTTFRNGFPRTSGPYGHAILAGVVFLIGLRFNRWLVRAGHWHGIIRRLPAVRMSTLMTAALGAGLIMTMVRGPLIGTIIAWVVALMGRGPNPKRRSLAMAALLLVVGTPIAILSYQYAAVGRTHAKDANQESAAYRKELIDKYVDIALEHAPLGWGTNGWPKVSGMPSIDNYYLLLTLMHGVVTLVFLLAILIWMLVRLLRNGLLHAPLHPEGSSLSFCLAGILAGVMFSILTVYLGENVVPIFFVLIGFAEGYLQAGGDGAGRPALTLKPIVVEARIRVLV